MRTSTFIGSCLFVFFMTAAIGAQGQEGGSYTFFSNEYGAQVCMGTWVPSTDVALPSTCQGQALPVYQFNAVSGRQTVERLDKLLLSLDSIDQKLAIENEQMSNLLEATANTQNMMEDYNRLVSGFLRDSIVERFDALPKELMENELFRHELDKLKTDILKEVEKHYSKLPAGKK